MNVLSEQSEERVKRVSERKLCLVVGSSVIDLFLEIEEAGYYEIASGKVSFKLGDKIPLGIKNMTIGGNGANISVGLERLGIKSELYTYLGTDILSKQIEETIKNEGIDLIAEKDEAKNSSLSLIFDFKDDRVIFSHHQERNHKFLYTKGEKLDFIFLTSIGVRWEKAYQDVLNFTKEKNVPFAFSPGMHQLDEGRDELLKTLKQAKMLFVNRAEAEKILEEENEPKILLQKLKTMGSEIVSITDGASGAYSISSRGEMIKIGAFGESSVEKTGAGDAYSSAFFAAYLKDLPIAECMRWGSVNAYHVMQKIGSERGLMSENEIKNALNGREDFKAEAL